jgi:tellurite resistance protein TehA-like permease
VVMWVLAMAIYALMTSLILARAFAGAAFQPDHWILMGGLAIATLAGARLHEAIAVATWVGATAWIPVLLYAHLVHVTRRAGSLRFAGAWWAAVFPLGMYSAATQATALAMGWPALTTVSLVFFWIALTAWIMVAFGGFRRLSASRSRT